MKISNVNDYVRASFDVSNLFTNVPLDETLSVIMDSFIDNVNENQGLNEDNFKKLLGIAIMYKQIEGVAMGSPFGPTLANFFVAL